MPENRRVETSHEAVAIADEFLANNRKGLEFVGCVLTKHEVPNSDTTKTVWVVRYRIKEPSFAMDNDEVWSEVSAADGEPSTFPML